MSIRTFLGPIVSRTIFAALIFLAGLWPSDARADHASFKEEIFPILKTYCLDCHAPDGAGYEASGLDMRTHEGLMKGTRFGPVIVPGDAFSSNLMVLIEGRANKEISMPHGSYRQEPTKQDRRILRAWIIDGARNSDDFRDKVTPILEMYCHECHLSGGIGLQKSGLDMSTYEGLMKGTKFGPVITPGDAFTSNLMVLMEGRSEFGIHMPYIEQRGLSKWEKHLIRVWINRGAKNN